MASFSDTLMEHFQSPANRGAMESAHLIGNGSLNGYPPFVSLYLRIFQDRIADASFQAEGCGVTIACGSMLTELVRGRSLPECRRITARELVEALDGIPSGKEYCAEVVIRALRDGIRRSQEQSTDLADEPNSDEPDFEQEQAEGAEKSAVVE